MDPLYFGCVRASTLALQLFSAFALLVGLVVYGLLVYPAARHPALRGSAGVRRLYAASIAGVVVVLIIGSLYFSSLDGFYRVELRDQEIHLQYILPNRTLTVPRSELAHLVQRPSHKSRWQLVLYTRGGRQYESAHSSQAMVEYGWRQLNAMLARAQGAPVNSKPAGPAP